MALTVNKSVVCILLLVAVATNIGCNCSELENGGSIWAVLVAGSNGYDNYRHQADVCHAYHVLREHGIPADHIITMMYDDIAYNPQNPYPGTIKNAPDGPNVYEGVFRDYIGKDVNSTNFLKVLTGDEEGMRGIGSGRVLKSGPADHVFINFVDHGADYLLCFPNETDELYAPDLLKAFMDMSEKEMYAKMVVYIEACESGSLFDKFLSPYLDIFAVTAAKRDQDSYACCWDDKVGAYLGDVFSVNWMDDSDVENLEEETLSQQYSVIVHDTNTSNPQEFGDMYMARMPVGQFMGMKQFPRPLGKNPSQLCDDAVNNPNVPIAVLQKKLEKKLEEESLEEVAELQKQIRTLFKRRRSLDHVMEELLSVVFKNVGYRAEYMLRVRSEMTIDKFPCYKRLTKSWFSNCYGHSTSPYGLQKLHVFANICMHEPEVEGQLINAMENICPYIKIKEGIM